MRFYSRKNGVVRSTELYTTKQTSPALHVRAGGQTYYGDLQPNAFPSPGDIAFRRSGQTYVLTERNTADIPAGTYRLDQFVTTLQSFLADGITRSLINPVSSRIEVISTNSEAIRHRSISQLRKQTNSGNSGVIYLDNGQFSRNGGSTWSNMSTSTNYTDNWVTNSSYRIILVNDIIFA